MQQFEDFNLGPFFWKKFCYKTVAHHCLFSLFCKYERVKWNDCRHTMPLAATTQASQRNGCNFVNTVTLGLFENIVLITHLQQ